MIFVSKRPQRLFRKKDNDGRILKTTKPDIDNMVKMVLDIMTKWKVWTDDYQVVSIQAEDYYCGKLRNLIPVSNYILWRKKPNDSQNKPIP